MASLRGDPCRRREDRGEDRTERLAKKAEGKQVEQHQNQTHPKDTPLPEDTDVSMEGEEHANDKGGAMDQAEATDQGAHMGTESQPPKLVAWDTRANQLHRVISIPRPVHEDNSFMQDLALDPVHDAIYIADMSRGDLVGESSPAIGPVSPGSYQLAA